MRNVEVSTPTGTLQARFRQPLRPGGLVLVMLGGLLSDQLAAEDSRAQALDDCCLGSGVGSIRFNYTAHGWHPTTRSTGEFRDVSITRMIDDALHVLRHCAPSKVAFAASSIGAGLLPFLIERLDGTLDIRGCFTVSAVSPDSLSLFVASALAPADRERLASGEDVELRSPTLPVPIWVHRSQMEDVASYRDMPVTGHQLLACRPRLLRPAKDGLSTPQYNEALARSLCGSVQDVVVVESGHEIPFEPMLKEFGPWIVSLD